MSLTKVADSQLPYFVFDPSGFGGSGTSADPFLNLATTNGTSIKSAVRAASTGNLTLSGTQTVDGIALVAGDRVLVKNQTTTANNGIYVVATGAWARATDADSSAKITGAVVPVIGGTVNSNSIWINTTINVTLGTTTVTFSTVIKAGTNLTLTGNSLSVNTAFVTTAVKDTNLSISANRTLVIGDYGTSGELTIFVNAASAGVTITLVAAASTTGLTLNVIKTDSSANGVTVSGSNINGGTSVSLSTQFASTVLKSNGTQYYIF